LAEFDLDNQRRKRTVAWGSNRENPQSETDNNTYAKSGTNDINARSNMKQVNLDRVRIHLLKTAGLPIPKQRVLNCWLEDPARQLRERNEKYPGSIKLPRDFETKSPVSFEGREYFVFSAADAKRLVPNSLNPHRLYVYCTNCYKLVPAGKINQHYRAHKDK
jgi:hypothetical protein